MKQTYAFDGSIIAKKPLAVSRPHDNFSGGGHSKTLQRLPRAGAKQQDTPVFFPASSLRGCLRRAAVAVIQRAVVNATGEETPFSMDQFYMVNQGVDTANITEVKKDAPIVIEKEAQLRASNPFISLFGRWQFAGHLGVSDAFPNDASETVMYVTGNGARVNEWTRSPEAINLIHPEDRARVKKVLVDDALAQKDVAVLKKQQKEHAKARRGADSETRADINQTIEDLENQMKKIKKSKAGAKESIQMPLPGYECIAPGVEMSQKMMLTNGTELELGLLLHSLVEFSRDPRLGGHSGQGAGEVEAAWDVKVRPVGSWKAVSVGRIALSSDSFDLEDHTDDKVLTRAADAFEQAANDMARYGIDFLRF
ncbi:MAG: hypothetical protein ACR2PS_05185 [Pseudomonadales bacterium]